MTRIAKIVKSNSHVDYVARVIDELDADEPPAPEEYGFAQFVRMPVTEGEEVVGVVYNTQLANPDYGSFGPRLSSHADLKVLSPDFLHEQGVLLGVLLLGWRAPQAGHVRAAVLSLALGLLVLCAQILLWWILYKVPEWSRQSQF